MKLTAPYPSISCNNHNTIPYSYTSWRLPPRVCAIILYFSNELNISYYQTFWAMYSMLNYSTISSASILFEYVSVCIYPVAWRWWLLFGAWSESCFPAKVDYIFIISRLLVNIFSRQFRVFRWNVEDLADTWQK